MRGQDYGTPFQIAATHATSAVCTKAGATGVTIFVTDLTGSSDKAGALLIVADAGTAIWAVQIGAGHYEYRFSTPLSITMAATLTVTVDGTSLCKSNVAGYTL
jgi:hypothetical protein